MGRTDASSDYPLAGMNAHLRTLMIADGPDEVHKRSVARRELKRYEAAHVPAPYPYQPW